MTVWAVHTIKENIAPALRFGEIRYVNQYYIHGDELEQQMDRTKLPSVHDFDPSRSPEITQSVNTVLCIPPGYRVNMERCYAEFNPGADYLLIAGDHLQLLALTALLVGKRGFLDVLRWDRQLRDYIPVRLSSGIVPPRQAVLSSGTDIGDKNAEETRRNASALALESPARRYYSGAIGGRKPPAQDDH